MLCAEAQIVKAAAEEHEDSLAAHVLMSLLEGGTFNSDVEAEDPDYTPQVFTPPPALLTHRLRFTAHAFYLNVCLCGVDAVATLLSL